MLQQAQPMRLLLVVAFTIFVSEFGIMVLLHQFVAIPPLLDNTIDATTLIMVTFPVLYYFAFKPLAKTNIDLMEKTQALRRAQSTDEAMLASIGDGMIAVDEHGCITAMSNKTEKMLGWRLKEIKGKSLFEVVSILNERGELITEDKRPIHIALTTAKNITTTTTTTTTYFYTRKDGSRFPVAVTVAPIMFEGKIIGAIDNFRDVTEERKSYLLLQNANNDLKKFKLALDNASDQVVITDAEGTVIYGNPILEKITGYRPEEAIGKKAGVLWKSPMPNEYYQNFWHTIKDEKKTFIGEIQNKRKNGELYTAIISVSPVLDNKENIIFFVAIERDVTKEREIDKAKDEFISLASHQMRTPLTSINWYSEMLLDGDAGELNTKQKEYFESIHVAGQQMNEIIKSFLYIMRLETGKVASNPVPLNLVGLAKTTLEESKFSINRKAIRVIENYQEGLPLLTTDKEIVHVVFQNLVTNAVKYTAEKDGEITFSLERVNAGNIIGGKTVEQDSLLATVHNNGATIPAEDRDKIFGKFFRSDDAKRVDPSGNGIGLYMSRKMFSIIGGIIWFVSEEGKGTTFYALLPLESKKPV